MSQQAFPIDYYLGTLVRYLDAIKYHDNNYTHKERIDNLHYAYSVAARHFAQPLQQETLKINPKVLEKSLRTITAMVIYCWAKVSPEVMAALTIHYTYALILDDSTNDPQICMVSFYDDLTRGKQQQHSWWRLVNAHFPNVLKHYGSFCSFNLIRSTLDFFEGCWIEQYNFHGYPGSHDYPLFLRRLNGLGHFVGASLFPQALFDEKALFVEITTAIAQVEPLTIFVNDLISFYKEFDEPRDQTSLVNNYCEVQGVTLDEALDKLTKDTIHSCEQMLAVFKDRDPTVYETLTCFIQGYTTWHLTDPRYRIHEIYKLAGDIPAGKRFCEYFEAANEVGTVKEANWAYPSIAELVQQSKKSWNPLQWFARLFFVNNK